jgi:lipopolysaccharide export system protein LptC
MRVCMAIMLVGTVSNATQKTAVAKTDNDLVDMFIMRDDVRFTETDEAGRKRWEVRGSRAESQSEDIVRIFNVKATFVRDNGEEICMYTEAADVNRRTREVETKFHVDIIQGDRVLSGIGMHINHETKKFQLFKNVQILTYRGGGPVSLNNIR